MFKAEMTPTIFGGDTGMTYDQIKRKRALAEQLMKSSRAPKNVGEGLNAIGNALLVRSLNKKADKRDAEMKAQFDSQFGQVAPNQQGLVDLANSPYAGAGHKQVINALMKGAPNFARGGTMMRSGQAVVGENGPEVVRLPAGAQVIPAEQMAQSFFSGDGSMLDQQPEGVGTQVAPEPWQRRLNSLQIQIPEFRGRAEDFPDDPSYQRDLQQMERERQQILERYAPAGFETSQNEQYDPASQERLMAPGADTGEAPIDPRELLAPNPMDMGGSFADDQAYQTAELSAQKLMNLQPEYAAPVEADINTTEGQRLAYLRRMMFADLALEDPKLAQSMTRLDNNIASRFGALGRLYTDSDFEMGKLMAEQFANAVLRNDSGAAAPEAEVRRYASQYFPQPNEGEAELQTKKAMRREVMRSLMQALGGDASPAVQQLVQEMEMLRKQADVPDGPSDISAEDKEFLKSLGIE